MSKIKGYPLRLSNLLEFIRSLGIDIRSPIRTNITEIEYCSESSSLIFKFHEIAISSDEELKRDD